MELSRRAFMALAGLGGLEVLPEEVVGAAPAGPKNSSTLNLPRVDLHGYGAISAVIQVLDQGQSSITRIACESAQKALLTQAKYLSDLQRIPGNAPVPTRSGRGSRSMPVWRTASGGMIACAAQGKNVVIVATADVRFLAKLWEAADLNAAAPADFQPRVSVPMYLDRWDRYGLLCYFGPESMPSGSAYLDQNFDYNDGLKFVQDSGMGLVVWNYPLGEDTAEGMTTEQTWSWVQDNARKRGIPVHVNTSIAPPQLWLANRYREQTMLKTPQFLGGYYGVAHDSAGVGAISWVAQEAEDALLGVFQHTVRRFARDPNIVGWLEPHGETAEMPQTFFLEAGPYADEALRTFLRGRYGTLSKLSERWYGESGRLKAWSDVHVPEIGELVGFGPDAIDLQGTWRVKYVPAPDGHRYTRDEARGLPSPPPIAPVPAEWVQPDFDDSGWDELVAPGNDRMLFLARSPLVYRRTLNVPDGWLDANAKATLVVWDMMNRESDKTIVHINGKPAVEFSHRFNEQHWSHFDVTGALQTGSNRIVMQLPRGILCYRAYLTREPIREYPHLGPGQNAKWVDMVEWNIETRGAHIRRGAEMIRQVDPDRSINFMAANDYSDPVKKACRDYGGRFHDTGGMAGFWTDWNSVMMSGERLPVTAEPGNGAPNPREFQLFWGRWLTEGLNGVHYFQNWGEIAWNPEVLKVFEANRTMYEMIGKYHVPFAKVAVLLSVQNDWLTGFPWTPEPGTQGGYYSAYNTTAHLLNYCPRDAVGAADFGTSLVDRFRVIIDSNSIFMDEKLSAGIEKYVHNGGVFITNGQTGRHSPIDPDSWPVSKLSGYHVTGNYGGRTVTTAPGQSFLASSDVRPETRSSGLRLEKVASDAQNLLLWDDGSVAAGARKIGSGYVVHMGAKLEGDAYTTLIGALLRHFGVTDRVPAIAAPRPGLHMRHFIANTGLHDIWVLFNESDAPHTTDLTFLPDVHPAALTDVVSGQKVEIVRDPAGDAVRGIALAPWQSRMFLSPRSEIAAAPLEWLNVQRGWWQGTVKPPAKHLPTPEEQQRFSVELTEGWAFKNAAGLNDDQAAALAQPSVDDSKWERRTLALWLTPGDKSPKRTLLRRKFTVPRNWTDGQITICADVPYAQFFHDTRLFVDGNAWNGGRKTVDGPYYDTLGGVLIPGSSHVLALDIQTRSTLTGSRGPIWLTYLPNPQARQDLAGAWSAYSDPLHRTGDVALPGTVRGMYLQRTVMIDAAHAGHNVVIHFEAMGDRYNLMINGRLLTDSGQVRAHVFTFNVTPMIRFGAENVIELVGSNGTEDKTVSLVEVRYYDKGVYP